MRKLLTIVMGLSLSLYAFTGCASNPKTYEKTTVIQDSSEVDNPADPNNDSTMTTTTTETTTTTTEEEPKSPGIIGSTFHVIGTVIAFPFKVIGKLFQAIF